jgi:uncharacterized membrane protein YhfC
MLEQIRPIILSLSYTMHAMFNMNPIIFTFTYHSLVSLAFGCVWVVLLSSAVIKV